jgi:hypothetical protein
MLLFLSVMQSVFLVQLEPELNMTYQLPNQFQALEGVPELAQVNDTIGYYRRNDDFQGVKLIKHCILREARIQQPCYL